MTWTRFMDMASGGGCKVPPYTKILVELPEAEARAWFEHRFARSPDNVTCECCGEDYGVSESKTLEQATAYDRGCAYDGKAEAYIERPQYPDTPVTPIADYIARPDVLVVRASEVRS